MDERKRRVYPPSPQRRPSSFYRNISFHETKPLPRPSLPDEEYERLQVAETMVSIACTEESGKKEKNKMAARKSREKKLLRLTDMQNRVSSLVHINQELGRRLERLTRTLERVLEEADALLSKGPASDVIFLLQVLLSAEDVFYPSRKHSRLLQKIKASLRQVCLR
ncbi:hypothetical protein NECID01_2058 [Nematocida sp. AWRm77]|nr:hypothetical protein NECID01_2058 [Nematocida sp. AWRm77]